MFRLAFAALALTLLVACQSGPPLVPDPPEALVVTLRTYSAVDGTRTLVLEDVAANRPVDLDVTATCYLNSPPSISLIGYEGRIAVEIIGSDRYLTWSNRGAPVPSASSISCNDITGVTDAGESVRITAR